MEPYEPQFDNPYPDSSWSTISDFKYETPLHLCRAIEAVQRREGDDADYIVAREYQVRFKLDGRERRIIIPPGMVTDLASVPRIAHSLIGRVGPHLEASIVHDFLYIAWQSLPGREARDADREFADNLMRVAMKEAGVSLAIRNLVYGAVRIGGSGVYARRDALRFVRIGPDGNI